MDGENSRCPTCNTDVREVDAIKAEIERLRRESDEYKRIAAMTVKSAIDTTKAHLKMLREMRGMIPSQDFEGMIVTHAKMLDMLQLVQKEKGLDGGE